MNRKIILSVAILVVLFLLVGYRMRGGNIAQIFTGKTDIGQEAAKSKATDFVKNNLVPAGTDVTVKEIAKEGDLYKITFAIDKNDITAYMTSDGQKFFPKEMDVAAAPEKAAGSAAAAPAAKDIPKSDTPEVQLFVMSYCPYGTQMEKGILPVLDTLKDKIKFSLEFVSYSMHNSLETNDRKELDENLRQYCIEKNQPDKLNSYLSCFLKKGQGTEADCMTSAGVNAATVKSCMAQSDSQFNVTKNFQDQGSYKNGFPIFEVNKDDNEKYNVQGSPTLIINGVSAKAARDSASILKTICSAFNSPPSECDAQLSATAPSPGFGDGTAASGAAASCTTPPSK